MTTLEANNLINKGDTVKIIKGVDAGILCEVVSKYPEILSNRLRVRIKNPKERFRGKRGYYNKDKTEKKVGVESIERVKLEWPQ